MCPGVWNKLALSELRPHAIVGRGSQSVGPVVDTESYAWASHQLGRHDDNIEHAGSARGCDLVGCAEWSAVALQWSACRVRSPRMCVAASDALCGAAPSDLLLDLLFDCMAWCGSVSLVTDFSARMRKSRNVWISANMRKSRNGCVAVNDAVTAVW